MEIIVARHGEALAPTQAAAMGLSDAERPLTDSGRRQTRAAAAGLRHVLQGSSGQAGSGQAKSVQYMLLSPLLRARHTADILRAYVDDPVADETDMLQPGASVAEIDELLHGCAHSERLLLIGHEPDLSTWISWSLTRKPQRVVAFGINSAALLEFPGVAEGGTGTLRWLLTGPQLRALAPSGVR